VRVILYSLALTMVLWIGGAFAPSHISQALVSAASAYPTTRN
jgi:hypothetical protein